jgi:hypothetical protein
MEVFRLACLRGNAVDELAEQVRADLDACLGVETAQGSLDHTSKVQRITIWCLSRIEHGALDVIRLPRLGELRLQGIGDQCLIQT